MFTCLQGIGRDDDTDSKPQLPPVNLTLVSFAVTRKAYQRITERFVREYEDRTGQYVKFRLSFGGSGTQVHSAEIFSMTMHVVCMHDKIHELSVVFWSPSACWAGLCGVKAIHAASLLHSVPNLPPAGPLDGLTWAFDTFASQKHAVIIVSLDLKAES